MATSEDDKAIENIQVEEYVWAQDVETGEKALKKVTEVFEKESNILVHVTIGEEVINTTQTHPFYVEGEGYVEADELELGDVLRGLDASQVKAEKVEIEYLNESVKVYNFSVEDWHNYFVSDSSVLVHNRNCEKMGHGKGEMSGNREVQQKQVNAITSELKKRGVSHNDIKENLHYVLHNNGYDYREGLDAALEFEVKEKKHESR